MYNPINNLLEIINLLQDMAEHRFTCTLRVYEAEKALRLIAAVGKAGHPAGVPVYFSESVILGGGGLYAGIGLSHIIQPNFFSIQAGV